MERYMYALDEISRARSAYEPGSEVALALTKLYDDVMGQWDRARAELDEYLTQQEQQEEARLQHNDGYLLAMWSAHNGE